MNGFPEPGSWSPPPTGGATPPPPSGGTPPPPPSGGATPPPPSGGTPPPPPPPAPPPPDATTALGPRPPDATTALGAPPVDATSAGGYVPPKRKGGRGKIVAAGVAAVAVIAGGTFAAVQLTGAGAEGGADTPEKAVDNMLAALEDNDVLGMIDQTAPGEREVVKDSLNDYVDELERLDVIKDGTDLSNVPGFKVDFEGMQYDVQKRNDRVSMVQVTGGQVTFGSRISELPLGDVILQEVGDDLPEDQPDQTVDIADVMDQGDVDTLQVGTIEQDGRWYVSVLYTAAELAATDAGYDMPAEPIDARGADSPEDAVVQMVNAIGDVDVQRMIELTPPDEMAALHDYGKILVDQARSEGVQLDQITVNDYDFETEPVTGGTKVKPTRLSVTVSSDDQEATVELEKQEGACVQYTVTGTDEDQSDTVCAEDLRQTLEDEGNLPPQLIDLAVREVSQLAEVGVVTTQVDGQWYVSPLRTFDDLFLVALQGMERDDLTALVDYQQQQGG